MTARNELPDPAASTAALKVVAFGSSPAFSDDSRWLAYDVGVSEEEPPRRSRRPKSRSRGRWVCFELPTRESKLFDNVARRSPSAERVATWRCVVRRPPRPMAARPSATRGVDKFPLPGSDMIVRDLGRGVDTSFGNVAAIAWQDVDGGHLLANDRPS